MLGALSFRESEFINFIIIFSLHKGLATAKVTFGPLLAGVLNSTMGIVAGFYFAGTLGLVAIILVMFWSRRESLIKVF